MKVLSKQKNFIPDRTKAQTKNQLQKQFSLYFPATFSIFFFLFGNSGSIYYFYCLCGNCCNNTMKSSPFVDLFSLKFSHFMWKKNTTKNKMYTKLEVQKSFKSGVFVFLNSKMAFDGKQKATLLVLMKKFFI